MYIILLCEIAAILVMFMVSRNKFKNELETASVSEKKLEAFLPLGLQIVSLFRSKYLNNYKKRIECKIRDLNGDRHAEAMADIYLAKKALLFISALVFLTFVGTQVEIDSAYAIFCIASVSALIYATGKQLDKKLKEKARHIQMDFPEFLSKLILLVNAGLTLSGAMQKIINDCEKEKPLYMELRMAINEINSGKPEAEAFENFARRCKLQEITMFTATLLQNLKKGNDELVPILRLQANTCWENRKLAARKLGEEASTKLLFPMMIIFVATLAMIMTPAIFQLNF